MDIRARPPNSSQNQPLLYTSADIPNDTSAHAHHAQAAHQSEELYKRSVMLVIWYKAHTMPLRFLHPLPTFPFLQLTQFPSLLTSLSLNQTSFLDAYNPASGHWEQHMVDTVRLVETEQRVLYRLRKSLLDGLSEEECPGIQEEIASQPRSEQRHFPVSSAPQTSLKRPATEPPVDASPPAKFYAAEGIYHGSPSQPQPHQYAIPVSQPQSYPQNLSTPKHHGQNQIPIQVANGNGAQSIQGSAPSPASRNGSTPKPQPYSFQQGSLYASVHNSPTPTPAPTNHNAQSPEALPPHLRSPQSSPAPIPYHPHPPLKRWPNDYTVSEVAAGFRQMDGLITAMPTLTQRAAFERVFGCRYVKSTVCRHRGVWRKAEEDVRSIFEAMGRDERAVWGEFVRRVEGRASGLQGVTPQGVLDGVMGNVGPPDMGHMQSVMQVHVSGGMVPHMQMRREEEESAEEAVMGSLGPPPDDQHDRSPANGRNMATSGQGEGGGPHNGMQQQTALYDSSLSGSLVGSDQR
ncbi:hypothetical protein FA95DRAFT_1675044 [Auriscalpium vulgare]|uniref:Uncharacterized protein n=1 Tax=Auriscalpium vulgare TaxID=40419 RepID=A0ACB8S8P8_9AGAM|nr:hypothetical protein FA95DRAFT_1675044 [Auriscalpium vulgare]